MIIVGISQGHNSSVSVLENGNIKFHVENERLSRQKYDSVSYDTIKYVPKNIDVLCISGLTKLPHLNIDYHKYLLENGHSIKHVESVWSTHHKWHASLAFYNSGFDKAICIIKDGMGSDYPIKHPDFYPGTYGRESGASFVAEYPNKFTEIDKHVTVNFDCNKKIDHVSINNSASEGLLFQKLSKKYGFYELDAGKVMGMAAYGKTTETALYNGHTGYLNNNILKFNGDLTKGYIDKEFYSFQEQCDFAFDVQEQTQFNVRNYIWDRVEETGIKNVCLSGGYFLNCVANYKFLKELPKDINIYVEPISSDAGQSLGIAKYYHHVYNNDYTKRPIKNLYLGIDHKYNKNNIQNTFKDYNISETSKKEVANLLSKNNIVALYQGRCESGPRALGNRSLLFNPTVKNGQDLVNVIKQREKFRPFACTILSEKTKEWFDIDESKFMMYAVDCKQPDKIPAVNHIDNTCRIQSLSKEDNQNFYELIDEFYKITNVPLLLNTSLNLAGDPIVETLEDLKDMLSRCTLKYIYLAEFDLLISKKQ